MVILVLFEDIFTTDINLIIILQQKWGWYLTIIAFLDILHCCGMLGQDETSRPSRPVRRQQCRVQVRVKAHRDSQNNLCREGAPDAQFTLCSWVCLRKGSLWLVNFPRFPWPWNENRACWAYPIKSQPVGPSGSQQVLIFGSQHVFSWLGDPFKFSAQGGDYRGCHDPVYEGGGSSPSSPHVWLVEHWWSVQCLALLALPIESKPPIKFQVAPLFVRYCKPQAHEIKANALWRTGTRTSGPVLVFLWGEVYDKQGPHADAGVGQMPAGLGKLRHWRVHTRNI